MRPFANSSKASGHTKSSRKKERAEKTSSQAAMVAVIAQMTSSHNEQMNALMAENQLTRNENKRLVEQVAGLQTSLIDFMQSMSLAAATTSPLKLAKIATANSAETTPTATEEARTMGADQETSTFDIERTVPKVMRRPFLKRDSSTMQSRTPNGEFSHFGHSNLPI